MADFYSIDPRCDGTKGLVCVGDQIIIYRRDSTTQTHPNEIDLPGGGTDEGETPFDTFVREVFEEFNLTLTRNDIVYSRQYQSSLYPEKTGWFAVARLDASQEDEIVFGTEGSEYMLVTIDDYLERDDAWPVFQQRTRDYLNSV